MIKWLALLLVAANLGFCAWTRGVLGESLPPPGAGQREPERLRQQVRPEAVTVLSPKAASAALAQLAAAEPAATGASAAGQVATLADPRRAAAPAGSVGQRPGPAPSR
jgi:hypothetical protein